MTEIIIINRGFNRFRIKIRYRIFKGQDRILFKTMFITEIILEGDNMSLPIDSRVVGLKPINPEDDGMGLEFGNMEIEGFVMVVGDGDLEHGLLSDRAM